MSHRITTIKLSLFITLCACFGMAPDAYAVTRTWDGEGGDNNWSTGANWSGNTVPTNADDVVFDATSVKDSIWDSSGPAQILSLTVNGTYTGLLSVTKATIQVSRNWIMNGSQFSAGTSTLELVGSGTISATFTPGSFRYYNITLSRNGGGTFTTTLTSDLIVDNDFVSNVAVSLTVVDGFTIQVHGNITMQNANGFQGTTILKIVGARDQTLTSSGGTSRRIPNVTVDKPSGLLTLSGTITVIDDWIWTRGNLNAGTSILQFEGSGTVTSVFTPGPVKYYHLKFARSGGGSYTTTVSSAGSTHHLSCTGSIATAALSGSTIDVSGDIDTTGSGCGGSTALRISGGGDQTITGSGASPYLPGLTIDKPSGTLFLSGTLRISAFNTGTASWVYTRGRVDAGTSTVNFESNITVNSGSMWFYNVGQINSLNSGRPTLASELKVLNDLSIAGSATGGLTTSNFSVTTKNLSLTGGDCNFGAGSSLIKVSGSFTRSACSFTQGTSTLLLTGTNQTITGSTTFYNLYKLLPPETTGTLTFAASSTTTIAAGGTARFMGTRGYPLSLRSSTPTTQYTITKTGSAVVEYADIQDAVISGATSAVASTNSGNNGVNWTFTREFVSTIRASGGDYTTLSGWESAVQADLTAAATKVFNHGGITGSIPDNSSVSGATSGATGTAVHVTSTQILIKSITGTFQSGEQIRLDVSNYVTSSDAGTGAIATAECYNDWRTGLNDSVTLSGWTTDADNFVIVVAPPSQSHRGKLEDTTGGYLRGFTLKPSASTAIILDNQQNNTRLEGIAIDGTNATATNFKFGGTSPLGRNLLSAKGVDGFSLAGGAILVNALAYDGTGKCFEDTTGATTNYTLYNVTARGCAHGFHGNNTTTAITIKNGLASGNATADFALTNTGAKSVTYSASSDATADDYGTTTGDRVSQAFTFRDATNKDFRLADNDAGAREFGTDLSSDATFPIITDIENESRPDRNLIRPTAASWDIGADEMDQEYKRLQDGIRVR